jgi:uridine phosphorylase
MVLAAERACEVCGAARRFTGIVHTKDSLFARELEAGPRAPENERFMEQLKASGVLASEMETSMLFTLAQVYTQQLRSEAESEGRSEPLAVEAGSVLGVIGDESAFGTAEEAAATTDLVVNVGLETVRQRALAE